MLDNAKHTQIFIAYASKDQVAHDTLLSHLNVVKRKHRITISSNKELKKADIVLMLISIDFMISDEYEAIKKQLKKQPATDIIPVLISPCDWELDTFIAEFGILPRDRQFVKHSATKNERLAYKKIADELREIIAKKEADLTPIHPNTPAKKTPWGKIFSAIIGLGLFFYGPAQVIALIAGLNADVPALIDKVKKSAPIQEEKIDTSKPSNPEYGTPIFTTDTSLFKILIIRFEDNLNEDDDTYCIGRSIEENLIQLKRKGLPIHSAYADTITSPIHPDEAERIQKHHNADVLIYGLANKIQENCTAANVCFRHVVANTIMANLGISKQKGIKHDTEYETMSHSDIEQGKLSVDEQSMETWVTGLVALKKDDIKIYLTIIEDITKNIEGLSNEEKADKFYLQGQIYSFSGQNEKAIASYTKAIALKPDFAEAYYNRGISYYYLKEYKSAILDYDKAIQLKPDLAEAYNYRGISYGNLKEYKSAILDFDKAIQLKPDLAEAYNSRGGSYFNLKEYKSAILDFDKAIQLKLDLAEAYYNRGISYDNLKEYKSAILDYDKTIQLKPDYAEAYNNRGVSYFNLKEYKSAILDFDKAIQLKPNFAEAYNNRGASYFNLKEYKSAISDFDKAIQLKPDFAEAYNNLGGSYFNLKEYKSAISDFDKAIQLKPNDAEAYYNRGISYAKLKEYKSAILDYDKAIQLKPDLVDAYISRGISYYYLKEYKKAILDYDKTIQLKPENAYAYNNRAYAHLKLNQIKSAKKDLIKSQELDAENSWVYRNWSIYYTTQKDFPKVIKNLQKAIDMGYNDKEFLQEEELFDPLRSHSEFKRILDSMDDENSKK